MRFHVYTLFVGLAAIASACAGEDGKDGMTGPAGAQGPEGEPGERGPAGPRGIDGPEGLEGPAGPAGPAGEGGDGGAASGGLSSSCLSPCHGFTGIVEQWKTSTHYATYVANLGGEEVDSWTGTSACGNCHALDGIEQRLAGNVRFQGTMGPANVAHGQINYLNDSGVTNKISESTYLGHSSVAVVHCTTCHEVTEDNDPHRTGEAWTPGSFPLRAPSGSGDEAWLEKSSAVGLSDGIAGGEYGVGNVCMWCHKSRKDVTNYITGTTSFTNTHWGPHSGPHADIYTGKGGYHYDQTYDNSSHQAFETGCVRCHMGPTESNEGIGNHSFAPQLSSCKSAGCHVNAVSFDVIGGQTEMKAALRQLRTAIKDWLTRAEAAPYDALVQSQIDDENFAEDHVRPGTTGLTKDEAGAVYNYLLIARGAAGGVHNPLYVKQLIFDSYRAVTNTNPEGMPSRPAP